MKHGWKNFRLGILEYIDIPKTYLRDKHEIKKIILAKEQFYLDKMTPIFNINKIAGSMLGYKHSEETRRAMGLKRKGKSRNCSNKILDFTISEETRDKLSKRSRNGVKVKTLDVNNNIVNEFLTIVSAAKYYNVDHNTLSKAIKYGNLINNHHFEIELKDLRVKVLDKQYNTIVVFTTVNKASEYCGIPHTCLGRYLKSGKLWKDKYYFWELILKNK
jgi:group I intron endonuclease